MRPLEYFKERSVSDPSSGCWNWALALYPDGYGHFGDTCGRAKRAHRGAWEAVNGPIPSGLSVLHRCDNPKCINPTHLFIGTHTDNMRDMISKGRSPRRGSQGPNSKLVERDVAIIKMLLGLGVRSHRLAALYGVKKGCICEIKSGRNWGHVAPMEAS